MEQMSPLPGMKRCNECGLDKEESLFEKNRNYCKECYSLYEKRRRLRHSDQLKSYEKIRYIQRRDKVLENDRKYRYGIDQKEYNKMINDANGKCGICRQMSEKLCIDHDHSTGKVRGMICNKCNLGLGHFNDNEKLLQYAIYYLKESQYDENECDYSAYFYGAKRGVLPS